DSLCWRMHFEEWMPIGDVPSLRAALGDPPRAAAEPGPGASSPTTLDGGATLQGEDTAGEIRGAATGAGDAAGDVPEAEATPARWAPTAASDLSALVSDELARAEEREAQAASDPM